MVKIDKKSNKVDYAVSVAVNFVLLIIFYLVPDFHLSFLTQTAVIAITFFELSFMAQILGYIILLMYDSPPVRRIIGILLNVVSFLPIYALYILYPFDFSKIDAPGWTDMLVRIFIILSMIGLILATIVEIVKIFQTKNLSYTK